MISDVQLTTGPQLPQEGDLYRQVNISGRIFRIFYGYYEDFERAWHDPMPVYLDFLRDPVYTKEGQPIVTGMQDICCSYNGSENGDSCITCDHFSPQEDLFGLCTCPQKKNTMIQKEDFL